MSSGRQEAIQNLLTIYQDKYNNANESNSAFFLHPSVSFVVDERDGGISVRATKDIPKGTSLLRILQSERVSLTNADPKLKKGLLNDIQAAYHRVKNDYVEALMGCLNDIYRHGDFCLAIVILQDLAQEKPYTKTWPTVEDMRQYYYPVWCYPKNGSSNNSTVATSTGEPSEEMKQLLHGTYTLQTMERYAKALRHAFDTVILPILVKHPGSVQDCLPASFRGTCKTQEEDLWEAFLYASSLIRSRSHEGRIPEEPEIIPLVDLINGLPSYCTDKINVDINSHFKLMNNSGSGVEATNIFTFKDIQAGQEIILTYGDIKASGCLIRYAFCPPEVVQNSKASLDVVLLQMPSFLAPPDQLRAKACQKNHFPHTPQLLELEFFFHLDSNDLATYKNGGESEKLKGARQFLVICHLLDEDALRINLQTGRLKGNVNSFRLCQLLLLLLDHALTECTSLNQSTNAQDFEKAADSLSTMEANILRVRVCQRDSLAQWRHAFCERYGLFSEFAHPKLAYDMFLLQQVPMSGGFCPNLPKPKAPHCLLESRGCFVCGRTIQLKGCSKCKAVKYCGRDHQILDWKRGHKKVCDPILAQEG